MPVSAEHIEHDLDHSAWRLCAKHGIQRFTVAKPQVCWACIGAAMRERFPSTARILWDKEEARILHGA